MHIYYATPGGPCPARVIACEEGTRALSPSVFPHTFLITPYLQHMPYTLGDVRQRQVMFRLLVWHM